VQRPHFKGYPDPPRDDRPSPPVEEVEKPRHTAIYYILGFATPEGVVGFEAAHHFGDHLELAAGIGLGAAASQANDGNATQWSIMPRALSGGAHHNTTFGVGLSGGPYTTDFGNLCVDACGFYSTQTRRVIPTFYTLWANVELGGEYWSRGGFAFRYFIGYAHGMPLSSPSWLDRTGPFDLLYFGIGLGYAF
jgi:hypothetical protein